MSEDMDVDLELAIVSEPEGTELSELPGVDEELALRVVAETLVHAHITDPVEVSLLVTNDEGIRALNRDFRHKDEATDVLSFPQLDEPLVDAPADQLWQESDGGASPIVLNGSGTGAVSGPSSAPSSLAALGVPDPAAASAEESDGGEDGDDELDLDDDDEDDDSLHLGDIAISRDTLTRQAEQAGHSLAWEFCYLLAHGVLHLLGYDDQTEAGYRAMVALQEAVLAEIGVAR